jgi:hypothetical protein
VEFADRHGFVDVNRLKTQFKRLRITEDVTARIRPLHWELEFADILIAPRSGFDLVIGNPPWLGTEWNKGDLLCEFNPEVIIRRWNASKVNSTWAKYAQKAETNEACDKAIDVAPEMLGVANFLGSPAMNKLISTVKPDLYKGFIALSFRIASQNGATGILHPPGIYRESGGEALRAKIFARMRSIFQFENQLKETMFKDIGNTRKYTISISGPLLDAPISIRIISNLFHPLTVDACFRGVDKSTACPGIKENGKWCLRGHPDRVLLFEPHNDRISFLHSSSIERVQQALSRHSHNVGSLLDESTFYIKGVNQAAAEESGFVEKKSDFPDLLDNVLLSPRHVGLGSPFQKAPKRICSSHRAYEVVNTDLLAKGHFPRALFHISTKGERNRDGWDVSTRYKSPLSLKILFNEMVDPCGQRSLLASMMPDTAAHTDLLSAFVASDVHTLLEASTGFMNILSDLVLRTGGSGHIKQHELWGMPIISRNSPRFSAATQRLMHLHRVLERFAIRLPGQESAIVHSDLDNWSQVKPGMLRDFAEIPSDFSRRLALIELDVLVAMETGIDLQDLISSVSSCFPVLMQYEDEQAYDSTGKIAFTTDKSLAGIGLPRRASGGNPSWEEIRNSRAGVFKRVVFDDTTPGGSKEIVEEYVAPFHICNREKDYLIAWKFFENEGLR